MQGVLRAHRSSPVPQLRSADTPELARCAELEFVDVLVHPDRRRALARVPVGRPQLHGPASPRALAEPPAPCGLDSPLTRRSWEACRAYRPPGAYGPRAGACDHGRDPRAFEPQVRQRGRTGGRRARSNLKRVIDLVRLIAAARTSPRIPATMCADVAAALGFASSSHSSHDRRADRSTPPPESLAPACAPSTSFDRFTKGGPAAALPCQNRACDKFHKLYQKRSRSSVAHRDGSPWLLTPAPAPRRNQRHPAARDRSGGSARVDVEEVGTVLEVRDGIARIYGLDEGDGRRDARDHLVRDRRGGHRAGPQPRRGQHRRRHPRRLPARSAKATTSAGRRACSRCRSGRR